NDLSVTAATPAPKKFSLSRVTRLRMPKPQTEEQANGNRESTESVSTRRQAPTRAASLEEPVLPIELIANQDDEIARTVFGRLTQAKKAGDLRHFKLDMNVVNGTVWLDGHVTLAQHKELALDLASRVKGVVQVVDNISIQATPVPVIAASTTNASSQRPTSPTPAPAGPAPIYRATAQVQPVAQTQPLQPVIQQLQPVQQVQQLQPVQQMQVGQPVPMQMMGYPSYGTGIAAARYDHPNLPQYAWPSYAAHPNYAAVSYPQQYSPSAWPYIGPFHPYPQVPLGWRKVELKWKDGWWMLDFKSK
ncbi:MAG: BON domain-containing protein, partial [Pirellulaceae bacterium]